MNTDFTIRAANVGDVGALLDIYRPYVESSPISFETEVPSHADFKARFEKIAPAYPWFVYERGREILGYAYGCQHRARTAYQWSAEVSVYVRSGYHGHGVGRALYPRLLVTLRELGYFNAFAGITLPNERSVKLHERIGFVPVGVYRSVGYKFGQWHDVGWWQLILKSHEPNPPPPRAWQSQPA